MTNSKFKTIAEYPAYDVVVFNDGVEKLLKDGDILTDKKHLENWKIGSVAGYAIECGEDPIEEVRKAVEMGHNIHFVMSIGACLSNNPIKEKRRIMIEEGEHVTFHGQRFEIKSTWNNNIELVKVS